MNTAKLEVGRKRVQDKKKYVRSKRGDHTIRLPFEQESYEKDVSHPEGFRKKLDELISQYPELFPKGIKAGYRLHSQVKSRKCGIVIRRIELRSDKSLYRIAPSFVLPYMSGFVEKRIEDGLLLRKYGVPSWVLSQVLGGSAMFWDRLECSLGRFSIVGTTIKKADCLPLDYACDEKISWFGKQQVYVAMTCAKECVLGMSVSYGLKEKDFTQAYGVFAKEIRDVKTNFQPRTVNIDGFRITQNAWNNNFKKVVLILCFLHGILKIRKWAKGEKSLHKPLMDQIWGVYHTYDSANFLDKMEGLYQWVNENIQDKRIIEQVTKLYSKTFEYEKAFDWSGCYRTSNMVDRQMDRFDRFIYNCKYFHGHRSTTELKVRAWALLHNFAPFCSKTDRLKGGLQSKAAALNGFVYHESWIQNLLCAASRNGFRNAT